MKRIPDDLLQRMADKLSADDRDEMAIPSYLHPNPMMRWMAWRRVDVVARHFGELCEGWPDTTGPVVMDFGCGTGVLFDEVSQYAQRIYGVDLVPDAARLLVDQWNLTKVQVLTSDQAEEAIPEHSLDVIVAAEVLEHIDPLDSTLTFFQRCLKPGGRLLVSLPTESALYRLGRYVAGFRGHYHHHNAASIDNDIVSAGFSRDRVEKVPLPGPFAIYWIVDYHVSARAGSGYTP